MNHLKKLSWLGYAALTAAIVFGYDMLTIIGSEVITELMILLNVPETFVKHSAGFMDAMAALITGLACILLGRLIVEKQPATVRISGGKKVLMGVIMGFGVCGLSGLWLNFVDNVLTAIPFVAREVESFSHAYDDITGGAYIWSLLSLVIIGPMSEELLHRYLVFSCLERVCRKPWFPVLVSGIIFGVWHGSFIQGVYTGAMGCVLGYVFLKTRDLRLTMLIHMVNNLNGTLPPVLDTDFFNGAMDTASYVMILPTLYILYRLWKYDRIE